MSEELAIDSLTKKSVKEIQPEEPKMYSIQLQVSGPIPICGLAVEVANKELGAISRYKSAMLLDVIDNVFGKADWLDITAEMPKDIAEVKMKLASLAGAGGRMVCGCGKKFTLRLGKAD